MAMLARMAMMAITIINSTKVKPDDLPATLLIQHLLLDFCILLSDKFKKKSRGNLEVLSKRHLA
jgi:hypothetical protein